MNKSFFKTILLLLILPALIFSVKLILDTRRGAAGTLANILVDSQSPQGNIPTSLWQNIAQGGEEPKDMIRPIIPQLRQIQPKLIRIDHIFDFYKVDQGTHQYDFSQLDEAVNSILATGAKPMLSLSYTPNNKITDWNAWRSLVTATAHRYSVEKNISGIYYEVWNEPDLFGGWHYGREPNYSTLYTESARAVETGAGKSDFKVGGPAITAYYNNWIKSLFKTTSQNNVRLDFISWHKYSKNLLDYENDFENLNSILADYPQYFNIERIITETGPNPEPDVWYDNQLSGIHLISLVTRLSGKIHRLFSFEAIDGPSPRSQVSTGWGMISHDLKPKPRFQSFIFLNQLQGQRLTSTGDGSWVTTLASKNGQKVQILLVNYDQNNTHAETVPLTIQNLTPGTYTLTTIPYIGKASTKKISLTTSEYRDQIYLDPNSAVIFELNNLK